jgi:hypothetical protein
MQIWLLDGDDRRRVARRSSRSNAERPQDRGEREHLRVAEPDMDELPRSLIGEDLIGGFEDVGREANMRRRNDVLERHVVRIELSPICLVHLFVNVEAKPLSQVTSA